MKSRYIPKALTSYALSITGFDAETAADNSHPLGLKAAFNSLAKSAKFALSLVGPAPQFP